MSVISPSYMAGKWRMMPGRQAVTYRKQTAPGVYTNYTIRDAWWRDLDDKEKAASRGVYVEYSRNWHIPVQLLSVAPAVGDVVLDGSDSYTVLTLGKVGGLSVHKLAAVNLVLAADLRDSITIMRPTNTQNAAAMRVPSYAAVYSDVPAKVQEVEGDRQEMFGKLAVAKRFNVFVGQRLTVTAEDRFTLNSVTYQIRNWTNPDRIDELMQLGAEVLP